tara:strand:+ start:90 stop:491 length:402 start_codon:yes stop_codon:yes gene_type:complete
MANVIGGGTGRFLTDTDGDAVTVTDNRLNVNATVGVGDTMTTYTQVVVGTSAVQLSSGEGISSASGSIKEMVFQAAVDNTGFIMVGDSNVSSDDTRGIRINAGDMLVLPINDTTATYIRGSDSGQQVNIVVII